MTTMTRDFLTDIDALRKTLDAADEALYADPDNRERYVAYRDAKKALRAVETEAIEAGLKTECGRCAGDGVVHFGNIYFAKRGGGSERTCFACGGAKVMPYRKVRLDKDPRKRRAAAAEYAAKKAAEAAEGLDRIDAFAREHPEEGALLKAGLTREEFYCPTDLGPTDRATDGEYDDHYDDFVGSLRAQVMAGRTLSEKQIGALRGKIEKAAAEKAARETPFPVGTHTVEGTIEKFLTKRGYTGGTDFKMIVRLDTGHRAYGTNPVGHDAEAGDRVTLTATFEPSADDPTFGFFKRPKLTRLA